MHLLFHHRVKKNYNGDNYVDDNEIMLNVNTGITIVTFNEKTLTAEFSTHTKAPQLFCRLNQSKYYHLQCTDLKG